MKSNRIRYFIIVTFVVLQQLFSVILKAQPVDTIPSTDTIRVTSEVSPTADFQINATGNAATSAIDSILFVNPDSISDAYGNVTKLLFNQNKQLETITDASNHSTHYSYDKKNRIAGETYATGRTKSYRYNSRGLVSEVIDVYGDTTFLYYNKENRLVKRDYPGDKDVDIEYNPKGQINRVTFGDNFLTYDYELDGRVSSINQNGAIINYSYDDENGIRKIQYPSGRIVEETRDNQGRISTIRDGESLEVVPDQANSAYVDSLLNSNVVATYKYDEASDRITQKVNRKTGIRTQIAYDEENRINAITHGNIAAYNSSYDENGNLEHQENLSIRNHSEYFSYDSLNRVIGYKRGSPRNGEVVNPLAEQQFKYGAYNNRIEAGTDSITTTYTTNEFNGYKQIQIGDSTINLKYDYGDNLIEDARYYYLFDVENRLLKVAENNGIPFSKMIAEYEYDALGRRIQATIEKVTTYYIYDEDRVIEEQDQQGNTTASYIYDSGSGDLISMRRDGRDYYYHYDTQGSVIALSDSAGQIVERYNYKADGTMSIEFMLGDLTYSMVNNPYTYAGLRLDRETYLYQNNSTFFHPEMGRTLSKNRVGYYQNPAEITPPGQSNLFFKDLNPSIRQRRRIGLGSTEERALYDWAESASGNNAYHFNTGVELMERVELESTKCNCLEELVVISHGWGWPRTKGYNVEGGIYGSYWINGFLGEIPPNRQGDDFKISELAKEIQDLDRSIKIGKTKFCESCHITLTGCRVGSVGNFVYRLAAVTGCTVISSHGGCSGKEAPLFTSGPNSLKEKRTGDWKGFSITYPDGRQRKLRTSMRLW